LIQEVATRASCELSKLIAKHGRLFSEGKFIKKCLTVAKTMCPVNADLFNTLSLSRNTVARHIEELAPSVWQQGF
jgi:hypothetical protein